MEGKSTICGREYKWAEHGEDLFSPSATHAAGLVLGFIAFKLGLEAFKADAVDAYYQAPEHDAAVVEQAPEYLERLIRAGKNTNVVWRRRRKLPGKRSAGQSWVEQEHLAGILVK